MNAADDTGPENCVDQAAAAPADAAQVCVEMEQAGLAPPTATANPLN